MIRVGLIGFLLLIWISPLQAGEKWALLIGVDDYIKGSDSRDLRGCENDVLMTREVLTTKFVFPEQNIRTLLSEEATTRNIIQAIEDWLIGKTQPEDIVYLHFSGHGSQTDDRDEDEDDGKDELICPSDVESRDLNTVITDDQLRDLLDRIPSRNVTVVLDACHSGTGTRDLALSRPRFIDFEEYEGGEREGSRAVVMTGIDPQAPLQQDAYDQQESPVSDEMPSQNKLEAPAGSAGMESGSQLRVTISGCQPDQTSADAWIRDDLYAGALTYHLVENMKKAPTDITYRELMERVVRDIKGAKYSQTPQIEGDMDRPLFGTEIPDAVSVPFAVIRSVRDNTVTLRVGTVQNVTVGSIYAVFPAQETAFEGTGLGRIKIVKVGRTSSQAMILEGGRIRPGYRAREILHHFGTDTLKLLLEVGAPTVRRDIQRTMASIGFVEIVGPGKHFDQRLLVRISVDGLLGALTFDGMPDEWIGAPDAAGLVNALRPHLENSYAIKHLANLDNPAPPFQVSVWANRARGIGVLDNSPDEKLVLARVGDVIRFNFRAETDCYLTMINLGTSGKITVLFPNRYRPDGRIEGGKVYRTETRGDMPFKIRAKGPPGLELVKVIATLQPLSLSSLTMGREGNLGTRSIESGSSFAQKLTRDLEVTRMDDGIDGGEDALLLPTDGWATDYMIIETRP